MLGDLHGRADPLEVETWPETVGQGPTTCAIGLAAANAAVSPCSGSERQRDWAHTIRKDGAHRRQVEFDQILQ